MWNVDILTWGNFIAHISAPTYKLNYTDYPIPW